MRAFTFFDPALLGASQFAAPCGATGVTGGGGTTFDCYEDGSYEDAGTFPQAGTGINTITCGNSPFGYVAGSDDFESYGVGAYAGGAPGASAVGLDTIYTS